ncbi:MAG: hypothetical protein U0R76_05935 [Candidatus Nanopelagicales bacterium]
MTPVTLDQSTRPDAPDQERTEATDARDLAVLDDLELGPRVAEWLARAG